MNFRKGWKADLGALNTFEVNGPSFNERLKSALWEIAMFRAAQGKPERAHAWVNRMKRLAPLTPGERAYEATLLLMQRQFGEAKSAYLSVIENSHGDNSPNSEYARLYSLASIQAMLGDVGLSRETERKAAQIPCSVRVRRALPLAKSALL